MMGVVTVARLLLLVIRKVLKTPAEAKVLSYDRLLDANVTDDD